MPSQSCCGILAPGYATTVPIATLNGNFNTPSAIAIDAGGNLFVADGGNGTVKEITVASGYVTVNLIASGFTLPTGIAVDSNENLFVADNVTNHLYELLAADGYSTRITLSLSFVDLGGVAVDAHGNVFTADQVDGIQEATAAGGYATLINLASGNPNIQQPFGIGLDAEGNVFFSDLSLAQVAEIPAAGGYSTVIPRLGALFEPSGVTVDSRGNIYVADPNNGTGVVDELIAATTTGLGAAPNPSGLGASVTFTATVSVSAGTPTGSVTFFDGANALGSASLSAGVAALTTSLLSVGNHSITASYSGDNNYAASTSATLTQSVGVAPTTTTLASSLNPSAPGQSVTFTASVSGFGGTVTFLDGLTPLGTFNVVSGTASYTTTTLSPGNHSITASYSGDSSFAASTSTVLTQNVSLVATAVSVTSSLNPSTVGQLVTFTAFVSSSDGVPVGSVTFMDGVATLGSGTLSSGIASFSTAALTNGSHSITAVYGGNTNFATSTSAALTQIVNAVVAAATVTTVTSSLNPSTVGQSVTFTAFVSSAGGVPVGSVTFMDGAATLGSGTLSSGIASFSTAALTNGSHSITAVYGGGAGFAASTSAALTQIVGAVSTAGQVYLYQNTLGVTGSAATDDAHFNHPVTGAVDTVNGHLFVADTGNDRVQVIDTGSLAVIATIGVSGVAGTDNNHLAQPAGVGFDPATGRIFVADTGNQRIQIFAATSFAYVATLGATGETGADNGHFDLPTGIHVNPTTGQLYVADTGNQRIQIFNTGSLAYLATLGTSAVAGSDNAHFDQPTDAELNPSTKQIMVADGGNARVQLFDATSLAYDATIGVTGVTGVTGTDTGHFALPVSAAFDPISNLVLVAYAGANDRVQVFDAMTYNYVLTLGTTGSAGPANTQFAGPQGLAIDPAHARLFIGDGQNDRVQVFAISPVTTLAAVLPDSRSVQLGHPATIFASVINTGQAALGNCQIALPVTAPSGLTMGYQTTNPTTNALTGTANTPVTIPNDNGVQSFLVSFQGTTAFDALGMPLDFGCAGAAPAAVVVGVDTIDLVMSTTPVPDIVALAASGDPGFVDIPGATGTGDFAVATVNLGIAATITASANTGTAILPVTLTLCQTNPTSGACLATPAASVTTAIAANATPTFGIFVTGSAAVPDSPAVNRVFVTFTDSGGTLRGATSVAVRTQ